MDSLNRALDFFELDIEGDPAGEALREIVTQVIGLSRGGEKVLLPEALSCCRTLYLASREAWTAGQTDANLRVHGSMCGPAAT